MNRRDLLTKIVPVTAALISLPAGAAVIERGKRCVLVCDRARVEVKSAMALGVSLGLPPGTRIVFVHCGEDQSPESAFALLEES